MSFCCLNLFALVRTCYRFAVRSGLPVCAAMLFGWFAVPARADVWGYIDAKDVAHFASSRLDERYELFFRGGESFAAGKGEKVPAGLGEKPSAASLAAPDSSARGLLAPPKLLAFFDVSPNYKAVKHLLKDASVTHGVDYELLQALIATESGFDTHAVSPKGAVGLMQLIPPTAQRYGVKPGKEVSIEKKLTDPKTNIQAGTRYLRDLINMFPGQLELALAAYNAGEGAVQRAGNKIPNYPETKNYVKTVLQLYNHLKPPVVVLDTRRSASRVRMEMMGGASGRGNMVLPLMEQPAAATLPPELKTRQN